MEKILLNSVGLLKKFNNHLKYKNDLLKLFEKESENIKQYTDYYSDNINKLDWSKCLDLERDWVKLIKDDLQEHFNYCANELGYKKATIIAIWFQEYLKNGTHGWHSHGNNYTGVYYVNFNKDCAKTQLIDPFNQNKIINVKANEGDIILFPSYVIHRSDIQKNDFKKTIISFNIEFIDIKESTLNKIKILERS